MDEVDKTISHNIIESKQERVNKILNSFTLMKQEIENLFKLFEQSKDATQLNEITKQLNELKTFFSHNAPCLPLYNAKICQETIEILLKRLASTKENSQPKKRFAFTKKVNKSKADDIKQAFDEIDAMQTQQVNNTIITSEQENENLFSIENKSNETITIEGKNVHQKDIRIMNIKNCEIFVYGSPKSIRIANVQCSSVHCGPTTTSVFISDCRQTKFHLSAQQFRVHTTSDCELNIHVISRCIIEDCKQLIISPLKWTYEKMNEHFIEANLNVNVNNWSNVADFNWLCEKPSPNFQLKN